MRLVQAILRGLPSEPQAQSNKRLEFLVVPMLFGPFQSGDQPVAFANLQHFQGIWTGSWLMRLVPIITNPYINH
ncbi:MAG: hypothetical protein PHR16_09220 [Methylovulum sp.]|nr:hypothetical protein [Methylovulum sp.]